MIDRVVRNGVIGRGRSWPALALRSGISCILFAAAPAAYSQDAIAEGPDPESDKTEIKFTLEGGINAVAETNLYWNLADKFAPSADFDSDTQWLEIYAKPGVDLTHSLDGSSEIYGGFSVVASTTLGTDAFDKSDTGRVTIEEAFLGFRTGTVETGQFDLSAGAQELKLGTGMLISNGASNGFERGAVKLGPRKAWERTIIARYRKKGLTTTAFFIDPNELASNNTKTHSVGADIRYDLDRTDFVGVTYVNVLQSGAPYPQAAPAGVGPPNFLDSGRDGLNAISFYGLVHPAKGSLPGFYIGLDGAYEWNGRIDLDAWGGRVKIGHAWNDKPWRPDLSYSYQTFSGDDPDTPELERFDPLHYEGSPASWATGSKAALVFINSNVQSHQLTLRTMPSPRDFLTLRAAHIRVNEQRSPIQFGQATRLEITDELGSVISGVTANHLADDFFVEYTRILTPNIFLTGGFSISVPGKGIENAFGGDAPNWTGGFVNVVVNF